MAIVGPAAVPPPLTLGACAWWQAVGDDLHGDEHDDDARDDDDERGDWVREPARLPHRCHPCTCRWSPLPLAPLGVLSRRADGRASCGRASPRPDLYQAAKQTAAEYAKHEHELFKAELQGSLATAYLPVPAKADPAAADETGASSTVSARARAAATRSGGDDATGGTAAAAADATATAEPVDPDVALLEEARAGVEEERAAAEATASAAEATASAKARRELEAHLEACMGMTGGTRSAGDGASPTTAPPAEDESTGPAAAARGGTEAAVAAPLFVKTLSGATATLEVRAGEAVASVLARYYEKTGERAARLVWRGKPLVATVPAAAAARGETLHALGGLKGGGLKGGAPRTALEAQRCIMNVLGGQLIERWPEERRRSILGAHKLSYAERKHVALFLYGNVRDVDLVYAAMLPRVEKLGDPPRENERRRGHLHSYLVALAKGKYDATRYYFQVAHDPCWRYLSGEVHHERTAPVARLLNAWERECVRVWREEDRWPTLAEQAAFLDATGSPSVAPPPTTSPPPSCPPSPSPPDEPTTRGGEEDETSSTPTPPRAARDADATGLSCDEALATPTAPEAARTAPVTLFGTVDGHALGKALSKLTAKFVKPQARKAGGSSETRLPPKEQLRFDAAAPGSTGETLKQTRKQPQRRVLKRELEASVPSREGEEAVEALSRDPCTQRRWLREGVSALELLGELDAESDAEGEVARLLQDDEVVSFGLPPAWPPPSPPPCSPPCSPPSSSRSSSRSSSPSHVPTGEEREAGDAGDRSEACPDDEACDQTAAVQHAPNLFAGASEGGCSAGCGRWTYVCQWCGLDYCPQGCDGTSCLGPPPLHLLCVEGGIGVGKSTALATVAGEFAGDARVEVLPEPVARWESSGALRDMAEGAVFPFQLLALATLMDQLLVALLRLAAARDARPAVLVVERSPRSNREVFAVENLSARQLAQYDEVHAGQMRVLREVLATLAPVVETTVLLEAPVDAVVARIAERGRPEEAGTPRAYHEALAARHEALLAGLEHETVRTDASRPADAVAGELCALVRRRLGEAAVPDACTCEPCATEGCEHLVTVRHGSRAQCCDACASGLDRSRSPSPRAAAAAEAEVAAASDRSRSPSPGSAAGPSDGFPCAGGCGAVLPWGYHSQDCGACPRRAFWRGMPPSPPSPPSSPPPPPSPARSSSPSPPPAHEPDPDEPVGSCSACGGPDCYCVRCGAPFCAWCDETACTA